MCISRRAQLTPVVIKGVQMKRVPLVVAALMLAFHATAGLLIWRVPAVSAQGQSTANMLVVTAVLRKCFVQTVPLDFGTYDPVQANATAPLDGQSTITVACTKGAAVSIRIDDGANASGQIRRMTAGATAFLSYELFKDDARTQRWGNTDADDLDGGVAPSRDPRQFIVYGRVAGAQDVAEGAFQDTVVVTVNF
jgi:spore coat protein U-like protein